MAVDAHNHLDDERLEACVGDVMDRAQQAGVQTMIVAGYDRSRWPRQLELAQRWPGQVYLTLGIHPWAASELQKEDLQPELNALEAELENADQPVVGLGELGLDKLRNNMEVQTDFFRAQLELANQLELPVVLHVVKAHNEVLAELSTTPVSAGGMVHAFTGSWQLAQRYLGAGLHVSVGGVACRDNASKLHETIANIPLDHLLVETDAPDQTPPARRPALNEPAFLTDVIEKVASLRGTTAERVAEATADNARRLFGLQPTSD